MATPFDLASIVDASIAEQAYVIDPPLGIPLNISSPDTASDGEDLRIPYPWEVGTAFSNKYHMNDHYLKYGVVSIADPMDAPSTSGQEDRPSSNNPPQGPSQFFCIGHFRDQIEFHKDEWKKTKWFLPPPYDYLAPGSYRSVLNPSPGQILVYRAHLNLGLRFPLDPFIPEILNSYHLALHQLMPNSVANIVAFISMCNILRFPKTLTLFRTVFKLVEASPKFHGRGWFSFKCRKEYKVLERSQSNHAGFRNYFIGVYYDEPWNIPVIAPNRMPDFGLNINVPPTQGRERLAAFYFLVEKFSASGEPIHFENFWLPDPATLRCEQFLSYAGISRKFSRGMHS